MPEAVASWIDEHDVKAVREIQKNLLVFYENDFSKHAKENLIPRIRMVWNSTLSQLAKENRKYIYGLLKKGARAGEFEQAIIWLKDYGLISKVNRISKPGLPLAAYENSDQFKAFILDVGLLCAMGDLNARTIIEGSRIFEEFKGALTEQFVHQEIIAMSDKTPYYWSAENSRGEIDFLIQGNTGVIPIEVKAGENLRSKSLKAFCDKYKIDNAIRTSMSKYREESWMTNIPLYAIGGYVNGL